MVRQMGVKRLLWIVSTLLPTARTAVLFALFTYLVVFPPNLSLISFRPEVPPFAGEGGYNRNGDTSALRNSISLPNQVLTAKPKGNQPREESNSPQNMQHRPCIAKCDLRFVVHTYRRLQNITKWIFCRRAQAGPVR